MIMHLVPILRELKVIVFAERRGGFAWLQFWTSLQATYPIEAQGLFGFQPFSERYFDVVPV